MREGDFSFVNFDDANLRGANLEGAKLRGANFVKTDLREANLKNTDLSSANMVDTDLRSADLENSDISGANMLETLIIGAKNIPELSGVQQKYVIDTQEKVDSKIAYLEERVVELKKIDEMERLRTPATFVARIMNERQVSQARTA